MAVMSCVVLCGGEGRAGAVVVVMAGKTGLVVAVWEKGYGRGIRVW